jgi:hypothetical protein
VVDIPSPLRVYLLSHLFDQIPRSAPYRDTEITALKSV